MIRRLWHERAPELWAGATFLRKWGIIGVLVGVGAGAGALALLWCTNLITHALLGGILGYVPPLPGGEGGSSQYAFHMSRPWLLPLVTGAVGLLGGFLTWRFAPETAGIGTNAAIRAFHRNEKIKLPTAIFKLITSALTIGGGLTSGREAPLPRLGPPRGPALRILCGLPPGNGTWRWRRV